MILSLDPSSTVIGWALLTMSGSLDKMGRLMPQDRALAPDRIADLAGQLRCLLERLNPTEIVVEVPSGHVNPGRHLGMGSGLTIYGWAVGEVVATCRFYLAGNGDLALITETEWTSHLRPEDRPKCRRVERMEAMNPLRQYTHLHDSGGDIADAIDLGWWWAKERICRRLAAAQST